MTSEFSPDDVKALWKAQKPQEVRTSVDEIRERTERDGQRVRRRTILGSAASCLAIAYFVLMFFFLPNVVARIGSCLCVLASLNLVYQLHSRRGGALSGQPTGITGIHAYRGELERQRDFHRGWWFWSRLIIIFVSLLLFIGGFARTYPELAKGLGAIAVVAVVLAILAVLLNRKEAQRYQHRIDELDALK
jgi:Flp pilus assembly protein TadB